MSREKFEEWYEKNNDFMINTQFVMEGNYYLDRHVRMAWLTWQEQQKVIDELKERMAEVDKLMDAAASDGTECVEIWALYKALRGDPS